MFNNRKTDDNRFYIKSKENHPKLGQFTIVVDPETGVNYIHTWVGAGSSMTPLLDQDGQVVIDK